MPKPRALIGALLLAISLAPVWNGLTGHAAEARQIALTMTKARSVTLPVDVRDVLVADPEVVDVVIKTPRQVYLIGRSVGDTNAFFTDADGNQVLALDIRVEQDLTALRGALTNLVPDADVSVDAMNGGIVITGSAPTAQSAETVRQIAARFVEEEADLLNLVEVTASQQVLIRVKVAEMRRNVAKRLGVNLYLQDGRFSFLTGEGPVVGQFPDLYGAGGQQGAPFIDTDGNPNFFPVSPSTPLQRFGVDQVTGLIEALEEQGYIKTLAEPNLTARSGEPASFLAGGEFPVPVGRDPDTGVVTLEFKTFGVGLNFTPVVLTSGRISMKISTEVSELSTEGAVTLDNFTIPALAVRRATTTVEMPSGGSLVLGGLLRDDVRNAVRGVPFLANLPILGAIFRSPDFERNETELVVIATPVLIKPMSQREAALPTDGFAPANDLERFVLGKLYRRYGRPEQPVTPGPDRRIGYIME